MIRDFVFWKDDYIKCIVFCLTVNAKSSDFIKYELLSIPLAVRSW